MDEEEDPLQWTIASEGQSMLEHRKFTFAEGLHNNRWRSFRSLEITVNIWNQARHKDNNIGGKSFWDCFVDFCQADVDFTFDDVNRHAEIIANIYYVLKHLRGKYISHGLRVLRLTLHLRSNVAKPGVCPCVPRGLDTTKLRTLQEQCGREVGIFLIRALPKFGNQVFP